MQHSRLSQTSLFRSLPTQARLTKIGLLSDSHGRAQTTRTAAALLVANGAQLLIHLGDVGSVEVIDALAGLSDAKRQLVPARLVFGNTDWDAPSLGRYAARIGVDVDHPAGRLTLDWPAKTNVKTDAKTDITPDASQGIPHANELVFTHGDDATIMQNALAQQVRYLCHGHTHQAADHRQGQTRIINPGALFRARSYSVAILDIKKDKLTFYPVGGV